MASAREVWLFTVVMERKQACEVDHAGELVHPEWCDLERCEALPPGRKDERRWWGEHRSAPVALEVPGDLYGLARTGAVWLSRSAAPWGCETYLRVEVGGHRSAVPVCTARGVLDRVGGLLAVAVGEARW
ncbi:MAG: hypothetical protein GXX79_18605 [Actinomycetales bacterium]|nr:hypothetical protein [Actinomycetales bacterium]